jgi:hypothetical protein
VRCILWMFFVLAIKMRPRPVASLGYSTGVGARATQSALSPLSPNRRLILGWGPPIPSLRSTHVPTIYDYYIKVIILKDHSTTIKAITK